MKSKLTDEDIPDLADIMGEKCFPVYSDNLLLHGNTTCIATSREWSSILNIINNSKTKTKVVTPTNHKGRRQFTELVKTRSIYMGLKHIANGLALLHHTR